MTLEHEEDKYDFSIINEDLNLLQKYGKKLFIQIQDVSFQMKWNFSPAYLLNDTIYHGGANKQYSFATYEEKKYTDLGWVVRRWDETVQKRLHKLYAALGKEFDGIVEGVNTEETSVTFGRGLLHPPGFSFVRYKDAFIENIIALKAAFPKSTVMVYANFMPGGYMPYEDSTLLKAVYEAAWENNIAVGGPDLFPYKDEQMQNSYQYIKQSYQRPGGRNSIPCLQQALLVMCHFMKIFLALTLALTFSNAFGQIVYDKDLYNKYNNLYKKLPRQIQDQFAKRSVATSREDGLAIFTEFQCDTLNKIDQKKTGLSKIILIDPKTGRPAKSSQKKDKYPTLFCQGTILNDTLGIQISGLFLDQAVMHLVSKGKVSISYFEHYTDDFILKENINDSLTNSLSIPTKIFGFALSDSIYKVDKVIYGSAEIITNSYYQKDIWEDNHFYKLRWKLKYYFKFRLTKNGT